MRQLSLPISTWVQSEPLRPPAAPGRRGIALAKDLVTGHLVKPDRSARQPGRRRYRCLDPKCAGDLTVARSKHGKLFFKHFPGATHACRFLLGAGSRACHDFARDLLASLLSEAFAQRCPMPLLRFDTPGGPRFAVPIILGASVKTEWRHAGGRVPDIAVLDRYGDVIVLIEIFHTHAVEPEKRRALAAYWWIEIDAKAFLRQDFAKGVTLNVIEHHNLPYEYEILGRQAELFAGLVHDT